VGRRAATGLIFAAVDEIAHDIAEAQVDWIGNQHGLRVDRHSDYAPQRMTGAWTSRMAQRARRRANG